MPAGVTITRLPSSSRIKFLAGTIKNTSRPIFITQHSVPRRASGSWHSSGTISSPSADGLIYSHAHDLKLVKYLSTGYATPTDRGNDAHHQLKDSTKTVDVNQAGNVDGVVDSTAFFASVDTRPGIPHGSKNDHTAPKLKQGLSHGEAEDVSNLNARSGGKATQDVLDESSVFASADVKSEETEKAKQGRKSPQTSALRQSVENITTRKQNEKEDVVSDLETRVAGKVSRGVFDSNAFFASVDATSEAKKGPKKTKKAVQTRLWYEESESTARRRQDPEGTREVFTVQDFTNLHQPDSGAPQRYDADGADLQDEIDVAQTPDNHTTTENTIQAVADDEDTETSSQPIRYLKSFDIYKSEMGASQRANARRWSLAPLSNLEKELIYVAEHQPSVSKVLDILNIIYSKFVVKPTAAHYEAMILANCEPGPHGSIETVKHVLEEMQRENIPVGASIYNAMLKVLAVHPDHLLRTKIMSQMQDQWIPHSQASSHHMITALLREGQTELAMHQLHLMHAQKKPVHRWLYLSIVYTLSEAKDFDAVLHFLYLLDDHRVDLGKSTWANVLDMAAAGGNLDLIKYIWEREVDFRLHIDPPTSTCLEVLRIASEVSDIRLAESVIEVLRWHDEGIGEDTWDMLIDAYKSSGDEPMVAATKAKKWKDRLEAGRQDREKRGRPSLEEILRECRMEYPDMTVPLGVLRRRRRSSTKSGGG